MAVLGDALVMIVRHEIVKIFLKIRAGAANSMHFILANHLGERKSQLGRTHRACERDEHASAAGEVVNVSLRGVNYCGGIEMTVVMFQKRGDRACNTNC